MFYLRLKPLSILILFFLHSDAAYSKMASKEPPNMLQDPSPLLDNKKKNDTNRIDDMIKKKRTMLLKTQKSDATEYMSLYDEIAELMLSKNRLLMEMGRDDDINTDQVCNFILDYQEVEFVKTQYYKTPFHDSVAKTLQNIASLYEQCHPPMTEKYLKSILKIKENIYLKDSVEVAKAHDALGDYYHIYMADFKKAIGEYEEAKRMREKLYGMKDPRITENYERLAFCLYYYGDKSDRAEKLLLNSIILRKEFSSDVDFPLYRAYMDAGIYYSLKGERVKHIDYFKKAKKAFSGEEKSDYERILRELSISSEK